MLVWFPGGAGVSAAACRAACAAGGARCVRGGLRRGFPPRTALSCPAAGRRGNPCAPPRLRAARPAALCAARPAGERPCR